MTNFLSAGGAALLATVMVCLLAFLAVYGAVFACALDDGLTFKDASREAFRSATAPEPVEMKHSMVVQTAIDQTMERLATLQGRLATSRTFDDKLPLHRKVAAARQDLRDLNRELFVARAEEEWRPNAEA